MPAIFLCLTGLRTADALRSCNRARARWALLFCLWLTAQGTCAVWAWWGCEDYGPALAAAGATCVGLGAFAWILRTVRARARALAREVDAIERRYADQVDGIAAGVAHELNNVLTAVLGAVDLARDESAGVPALQGRLALIDEVARRMPPLTRDLLLYAGKGRISAVPDDVTEAIRTMEASLRALLPDGMALELDLQAGLPAVRADRELLRQVLAALVAHAAAAPAPSGGRVRVRTCAVPAGVRIEVEDNGTGMDAPASRRVFEPLARGRAAGRVLGLAAARGIVQAHGGEISVESAIGRGTRFRIDLPAAGGLPLAQREAPRLQAAGARLLVVDDEEPIRVVLRDGLARLGFQVRCAPGAAAALEVLASGDRPDAVLMDVTMPGMSPEDALDALHARYPELPVVLMSGFSRAAARDLLQRGGACAFLHKPFRVADAAGVLVEAIRSASGIAPRH